MYNVTSTLTTSDLETGVGGDLGLAKMPAGAVTIAESPHRGHHQLVTCVNGPGPDCQGAKVGATGVHNRLVHVIPGEHILYSNELLPTVQFILAAVHL